MGSCGRSNANAPMTGNKGTHPAARGHFRHDRDPIVVWQQPFACNIIRVSGQSRILSATLVRVNARPAPCLPGIRDPAQQPGIPCRSNTPDGPKSWQQRSSSTKITRRQQAVPAIPPGTVPALLVTPGLIVPKPIHSSLSPTSMIPGLTRPGAQSALAFNGNSY